MLGTHHRSPAALFAGGLALAVLIGCGGKQTVASKSAAAFRDAQQRGETFGGDGHAHGAVTPGGETGAPESVPSEAAAEGSPAGHEHAGAEAPAGEAMRHDGEHAGIAHPGATPRAAGEARTGGHAATAHGQSPASPGGHRGQAAMQHGGHPTAPSRQTPGARADTGQGGQHAGHGTMPHQAPAAGTPPADHAGHDAAPDEHAGHGSAAPGQQATQELPAPAAVPAGQPAATLRPDPLDAPAATAVIDALRAAALAREMAGGGHAGHGAGTYRQLDAGREPGAQPPPPEAPPPDHHHHATAPPARPQNGQEGTEHDHEPPHGSGGPPAVPRRPA